MVNHIEEVSVSMARGKKSYKVYVDMRTFEGWNRFMRNRSFKISLEFAPLTTEASISPESNILSQTRPNKP